MIKKKHAVGFHTYVCFYHMIVPILMISSECSFYKLKHWDFKLLSVKKISVIFGCFKKKKLPKWGKAYCKNVQTL